MAEKIVKMECLTCGEVGRTEEDISHLVWCEQNHFVNEQGRIVWRQRLVRWHVVPVRRCLHGRDVTLSPHECEDCSQAIAESRCSQM